MGGIKVDGHLMNLIYDFGHEHKNTFVVKLDQLILCHCLCEQYHWLSPTKRSLIRRIKNYHISYILR